MAARIANLSSMYPEIMQHLGALGMAGESYGLDPAVLELTHLRASQLNGCSWCLDFGLKGAREAGLTDAQLIQIAGWRDAKVFSPAQRAALDLAEHMTRLADQFDAVPDDVWASAAEQFDDRQLAGLVVWIATTNLYNRINVTLRREPGTW